MLKAFEKIRKFGVFKEYSHTSNVEDFSELNLIYGWNYSGKTTLSRILRSIEMQTIHPDYSNAQFVVSNSQNLRTTETSLYTNTENIRVFNSDFVKENLSWEGGSFNPIFLLGKTSIEANKEIKQNEGLLEILQTGFNAKNKELNHRDTTLRKKKRVQAQSIKQTLQLIYPFNATNLDQTLFKIKGEPSRFIVDESTLHTHQQAATADENSKLPKLPKITIFTSVSGHIHGLSELLNKKPQMTSAIQYLLEHPDVARWIRSGLPLHEGHDDCEFCGNRLLDSRKEELKAHFSGDIDILERSLRQKKIEIETMRLKSLELHQNDFYPSLRAELIQAQESLNKQIVRYNEAIYNSTVAIDKKLLDIFENVECPIIEAALGESISTLQKAVNKLIEKNNKQTESFEESKTLSIDILKSHLAAKFYFEEKIESEEILNKIQNKHKCWYEQTVLKVRKRNITLEAEISQAQKGREELNTFIERFLTGSNISVEIVTVGDIERFRLIRNEVPAKNLSEGERTAIAYAFFLIKLKETLELRKLVVYIDDPVSSLDSNHIFQINSATKSFFFWQDKSDGDKWKLTVEQLFISTHNFEFLGLIKELPIKKNRRSYYYLQRLSAETSTFITIPPSIIKYSSEYQYLWSVIHNFHISADKSNLELLLALPNALRRFVELYTYAKFPSDESVDIRADRIFGKDASKRILKLLHHFSHSNNLLGIAQNSDLICDVEKVVTELIDLIQEDQQHYDALMMGVS